MPSISRWDPFRGLTSFQDQLNRLFEDTFFRGRGDDSLTSWAPTVDIYETDSELVLKVDLPEMNENDLDIQLENNMLTISGERKFEQRVSQDNYLRLEQAYGSFSRSFSLPTTVNQDGIKAEHKNGVLTVHMPKREEAKPKQIKLSLSSN